MDDRVDLTAVAEMHVEGASAHFTMPDPRPIPPVPSDWTATPEGLSREDEYVVAGAAQTLDGDPPFSEAALLAVGCDLLAIVRRLTKEPK